MIFCIAGVDGKKICVYYNQFVNNIDNNEVKLKIE